MSKQNKVSLASNDNNQKKANNTEQTVNTKKSTDTAYNSYIKNAPSELKRHDGFVISNT